MNNAVSIARPYAKALFARAQENDCEQIWSDILNALSIIIDDPQFKPYLHDPQVVPSQLIAILTESLSAAVSLKAGEKTTVRNLLMILIEKKRLSSVPAIYSLYDHYLSLQDGVLNITVKSAQALDESEQSSLKATLVQRFNSKLKIHYQTDPSLIGGMVIQAGDKVRDRSMKTSLLELQHFLRGSIQ